MEWAEIAPLFENDGWYRYVEIGGATAGAGHFPFGAAAATAAAC